MLSLNAHKFVETKNLGGIPPAPSEGADVVGLAKQAVIYYRALTKYYLLLNITASRKLLSFYQLQNIRTIFNNMLQKKNYDRLFQT